MTRETAPLETAASQPRPCRRAPGPDGSTAAFDARIRFDDASEIVEFDLSNLRFEGPADVHRFYDAVEGALAGTDHKWFFLVDYSRCQIDPAAWGAFAARGKKANIAYAHGSVRFQACDVTGGEIQARAASENFDPNLCDSRAAALARIETLRADLPIQFRRKKPTLSNAYFGDRVSFDGAARVMEIDMSDLVFTDGGMVSAFYDELEHRIAREGGAWRFLVNYRGCRIMPEAWLAYAARAKRLHETHCLGSARYAVGDGAQPGGDVFASREAALAALTAA